MCQLYGKVGENLSNQSYRKGKTGEGWYQTYKGYRSQTKCTLLIIYTYVILLKQWHSYKFWTLWLHQQGVQHSYYNYACVSDQLCAFVGWLLYITDYNAGYE